MKEEQKVSFIHSISAKIMLLTVLAVVMSVLIVAFRAEAGAKKVVGDVSADYILSMAEMGDRKSTRLNSSHNVISRMPSSA